MAHIHRGHVLCHTGRLQTRHHGRGSARPNLPRESLMTIYTTKGTFKCHGTLHVNSKSGMVTFLAYHPTEKMQVTEIEISKVIQIAE
jgi:hypothetical protein